MVETWWREVRTRNRRREEVNQALGEITFGGMGLDGDLEGDCGHLYPRIEELVKRLKGAVKDYVNQLTDEECAIIRGEEGTADEECPECGCLECQCSDDDQDESDLDATWDAEVEDNSWWRQV